MFRKLSLALLLWPYALTSVFCAVGVLAYESRVELVEWFYLDRTNEHDFACWVKGQPQVIFMGSSMPRLAVDPIIVARANGLPRGQVVTAARNGATPFQGLRNVRAQ